MKMQASGLFTFVCWKFRDLKTAYHSADPSRFEQPQSLVDRVYRVVPENHAYILHIFFIFVSTNRSPDAVYKQPHYVIGCCPTKRFLSCSTKAKSDRARQTAAVSDIYRETTV